eukprot:11188542-Lingulodinium_polyedra.AAC.1
MHGDICRYRRGPSWPCVAPGLATGSTVPSCPKLAPGYQTTIAWGNHGGAAAAPSVNAATNWG